MIYDVDAKKLAHAPPVHLECDQAILRLGNAGNDGVHRIMNSEDKADAKMRTYAPPVTAVMRITTLFNILPLISNYRKACALWLFESRIWQHELQQLLS